MKSVLIFVLFLIYGNTSYRPVCDYCNHPKACKDICDKTTFWFDVRRIKYICKKYCNADLTQKCLCENRSNTPSLAKNVPRMEKELNMKLFGISIPKIRRCLDFCTGKNFWTRITCILYCLIKLDL